MLTLIPRAASRILLSLTLIFSGLMVCIHFPPATEFLSKQTSSAAQFNVDSDTIAKASSATRDFALGTIKTEGLKSALTNLGLPADSLDTSMLTHLQDCTWVFKTLTNLFITLAIASLVCIVLTGVFAGHRGVSRMLWQSSLLAILLIALAAFWIVSNFESFFTWMHSLFFNQGTWTFSADSLLITMFPENFWKGMGIIWGGTSILSSIIAIIVAQFISGR